MEYLKLIGLELEHAIEQLKEAKAELAKAEKYYDEVLTTFIEALH
jgi:hypothetical protein